MHVFFASYCLVSMQKDVANQLDSLCFSVVLMRNL